MIRATLNIGGNNLTNYIKYPISITDKNLDESLNIYEITLYSLSTDTPYKPNTIVSFSLYQDDTLYKSYELVITSDIVDRVGASSMFHHKLTMLEKTYLLSLDIIPDMTITRIVGIYEPTLKDVALKILAQSEGQLSNTISISTATAAILDAIKSPELTLTRYTTLEALRLVFGMAKIVPYLQTGTALSHIAVKTTSTTIANSVAKTEAYDPSTYRTRLYSTVENFVGGGDENGSITEPSNAWLSVRSPNNIDIMPDNSLIRTTRPIYKIEHIEVKTDIVFAGRSNSPTGTLKVITIPTSMFGHPEWFEPVYIDDYVVEKDVYDTQPNTDAGKGSFIYYEQGKNDIKGLTYIPPQEGWWDLNIQAYRKITQSIINLKMSRVKPEYLSIFRAAAATLWSQFTGTTWYYAEQGVEGGDHYMKPTALFNNITVPSDGRGPEEIHYTGWGTITADLIQANYLFTRVKYTPYINTKLFTYKERKENEPAYQSTMYYNQSANVINDVVLGELHDRVIKRGSGTTLTEKLIHTDLSQLIDVGTRVGDYIITAKDYTLSATDIVAEYILSKHYAKLNQYVAVLEKFRQFSIPNENIVDRQYTVQEFVKFSTTKQTKTAQLALSSYLGTKEINLFKISTFGSVNKENLIYYPTSFSFNNALVFEVQFPTQATAGGQSTIHPAAPTDPYKRMEQTIAYTNTNGIFSTATFSFATNFLTYINYNDSYNLPISTDLLETTHATFTSKVINKDARERLSISYILHHIDESGKVYINRGWAARNALTGGSGISSGLKVQWTFGKPNGLSESVSSYGTTGTAQTANFVIEDTSIKITPQANPGGGVAWSVIDEDNNILFWVDETTASTLYLNFSSTY